MSAQHHDFVLLVAAGDFPDRVVGCVALGIPLVRDVDLERDRRAVGQHARDPAVVVVSHHQRRRLLRFVVGPIVRRRHDAVPSSGIVDADGRFVGNEEVVDLCVHLPCRQPIGWRRRRRAAAVAESTAALSLAVGIAGGIFFISALGFNVGQSRGLGLEVDGDGGRFADEHSGSRDLARHAAEIRGQFGLRRTLMLRSAAAAAPALRLRHFRALRRNQVEGPGRDGPFRAGRPGEGLHDERRFHRRHDVRLDELVRPAGMSEFPRLEVRVAEAPFGHLLDRPLGGGLVIRRARQPRAIDVGEEVHRVHDLRVRRFFLPDLVVDLGVDF
jgi:hypothetical protein